MKNVIAQQKSRGRGCVTLSDKISNYPFNWQPTGTWQAHTVALLQFTMFCQTVNIKKYMQIVF